MAGLAKTFATGQLVTCATKVRFGSKATQRPPERPVYFRFTLNSDRIDASQRSVAKCQKLTHVAQQKAVLIRSPHQRA